MEKVKSERSLLMGSWGTRALKNHSTSLSTFKLKMSALMEELLLVPCGEQELGIGFPVKMSI